MRKFINIIEAKIIDGYYSGLSHKEMTKLALKADLRGVAANDKIYVQYAYGEIHWGMRNSLGIPQEFDDNAGFNFYVTHIESESDIHERDGGREEWGMDSVQFKVGKLLIQTNVDSEEALLNKEFARIINI
jgi:hypothetical protein